MEYDREQQLTNQLSDVLRGLHGFRAFIHPTEAGRPDSGIDAKIDVELPNTSFFTLAVTTKKAVYPRDVRDILWQLRGFRAAAAQRTDHNVVPLIAATIISSGAKQILKEENVGYFDSGGSLFIPAGGAYVLIDKPAPKALNRSVLALFRGKRSQIVHTLLHLPQAWFGVAEIADLAHVSAATASETLTELERLEWIEARGNGPSKERRVSNPRELLDQWAKFVQSDRKSKLQRYYVPTAKVGEIARRLAAICNERHIDYALTQEFAAQLYTPFLTNVTRLACYLSTNEQVNENVVNLLGANPVTEGYNLTVFYAGDRCEQLFREEKNNLWLASSIIIYLDLLRGEGRAKEMADHFRSERIGF